MKQLVQDFKTGEVRFLDTPAPKEGANSVIVEVHKSLVSAGTEKMLVEFGRASLFNKARKQPEKVQQVLQKIKTDGLLTTIDAVRSKLAEPIPLGYSCVGEVVRVGANVTEFNPGDMVLCAGPHSEVVRVSKNLCVKVPENVNPEAAAFTVVGSIALQGMRLMQPELGESVAVIGLGLIGQIAVQLLAANGCRVIGIDIDPVKVEMAKRYGAVGCLARSEESYLESVNAFSKGRGVDGVLLTASAKNNEPLVNAAKMCRTRGRIVLVGVVPIDVPRALFYEKELSFTVSSSYGPGRYDDDYESKGFDYPLGYVRWTAQRNFEAVLDMMSASRLDTLGLVTERIPFAEAPDAYSRLLEGQSLGVIFEYEKYDGKLERVIENRNHAAEQKGCVAGFAGVGNFAKMVLMPALARTEAKLHTVASTGGLDGAKAAESFGFDFSASEYESILENPDINTVFIATRSDSHAGLVCEALKIDKNVFVEKPLALSLDEISEIERVYENSKGILMVGFNRRFSPFSEKMRDVMSSRKEPVNIIMTINAGQLPENHWVFDPLVGGGRIIQEGCHFIDLARFLVGAPIDGVQMFTTKGHTHTDHDKGMINLRFKDGSAATVHYLGNGSKSFPKERIEAFYEGKVLVLDNFKSLKGFGVNASKSAMKQDKGHTCEVELFVKAVEDGTSSPISFEQIIEVSKATCLAMQSFESGLYLKL